ncbi:MAG TPA: hypothetical protein PLB59_09795 [Bacteroidales bacterium]|nr:hypothetical protein [Bacteroidales bacterium]HQN16684.1 hypothetical protein [Bacteroidales bacterium]HQP16250.1 hypothetical protein [Bacteroidales bacterium]
MKRFIIPVIILLSFFTASGQISDTTFFNNAKPMLGDPKSAINFWTGNAFFHGNIIADTVWGTTRIDVFSYDTIHRTRKINVDSLILINNIAGTTDSFLIRDNSLIKYKILDMSPYLSFSDTASTLLTQSKAINTYQPIGDYTEFSDTTSTLLTKSNASKTYQLKGNYTVFADTASTLLTLSKASKNYQLKYWSKSGTAITPYTSSDVSLLPRASFFQA